MDAPVPLMLVALLAAAGLVAPVTRARAAAMLGALALTPAILMAHIRHTDQFRALVDRPGVAAAVAAAGLAAVAVLAWGIHRRPGALPVLAVVALPFRVPVAVGATTTVLLVPLYIVVAAGVLAYAVPRVGRGAQETRVRATGALEWALASYLVLYAAQAWSSPGFDRALESLVLAYAPFALLYVLVSRLAWTPSLTKACLGAVAGLALAFAAAGFVEYATGRLLLNPTIVASSRIDDPVRVTSPFFDAALHGRFLALAMVLVTAWCLWARRPREAAAGAAALAVLWCALVLTVSWAGLGALLAGLLALGVMRWGAPRAVGLSAAVVAAGVAVAWLAPGALGGSGPVEAATTGRGEFAADGVRLFRERPVGGWGAGGYVATYRRAERAPSSRAVAAARSTPVTVAAEQGAVGLAAYLAILLCALWRLLRRAAAWPARAALGAAFVALLAHTVLAAAFLEDPMTWMLLAVGTALATAARRSRRAPSRAVPAAPEPEPEPAAV